MNRKLLVWCLVALAVGIFGTVLFWSVPALGAVSAAGGSNPAIVRWAVIAAAVATSLSSVAAALAVGRVGSAAVGALAEKPEPFGRLIVLVGLAEGIAIYGLIISILILNQVR